MQTDLNGGPGLAVVAGDVLALRGTGLAAAETWALLCQAAQALQDLFLSNGGVVGGSRAGPVVTPHTLELTPLGRVLLQLAPPETARAYLPPEYRPGRVYSDTDSEKMWMYSLGRALLDTTPRVAALTGTVSVSPSSALQSVLAAMTEPDPRRRASLMNLLDVISEYCRTRLQTKPFTHIVMDMYREVVKSPQYTARKRIAYQHLNPPVPPLRSPSDLTEQNRRQTNYPHHHHHHHQQQQQPSQQSDPLQCMHSQAKNLHQDRQYHSTNQYNLPRPSRQRSPVRYQLQEAAQQTQIGPKAHHHHHYHHHHPAKGALFKLQSRNSHSHPNLTTLCGQQQSQPCRRSQETEDRRTQFHSQLNVQQTATTARSLGPAIQHQRRHHHSRTYSQPIYTRLQHTRSSGNLSSAIVDEGNPGGNVCNDPIYALPVKPFLSSQDVRVNGLSVKPPVGHRNEDLYTTATIARRPSAAGYSHPDIPTSSMERGREEIYGRCAGRANPTLQRQHSNPQLPSRDQQEGDFGRLPEQSVTTTDHRCPAGAGNREEQEEQTVQQQNPVSSMRVRSVQGPPKPPRIITTLKKAPFSDVESSKSEPPAKPPRNLVKNGPRARRGKAVQRAPSRLYRTVGVPTRSFNKAQCVGPEFVVRANQPSKTLCVGQVKASNSGRIVVIMLTGQRVEVTCDPQKVTAGDLFQAIMQAESLDENFTLGLAVLLAGDFAILPPDTKLNKVAPPGWLSSGKNKGLLGLPTSFMLYLRLRFFLPSLRGVRSWISKHLLYLQIRRCILEQQLVCPYPELINLTGLALQAEFGNYNVNEHGCGDYFLLEHYVPESLILNIDQHQSQINNGGADVLRARLHQAHRDRRGLDSNKAEEMFITHAQTLPDYGSHYYIATVDSKELEKVMAQQRKRKLLDQRDTSEGLLDSTENIYKQDNRQEYLRGRIEISRLGSCENIRKIPYDERKPAGLTKSATSNDIYGAHRSKYLEACNNNNVNNVNNNNNNNNNKLNHDGKSGKSRKKKTESNVWLAIHAQGLKLFERGGEPRERIKLAQFQWKDIQTLNYSKSCLVVCSKVNGKRCKFKLRMDHRKSYFAFKLTSLHHQFFLRLRSELTSLQGLAKEFGVPTTIEAKASPSKSKSHDTKTKIAIANTVKNAQLRLNYSMQLEEYQNKENENPQKDVITVSKAKDTLREQPGFYPSEEDALYAQVNVRLEPEGESRDTEDESERSLTSPNEPLSLDAKEMMNDGKIYNCPRMELETETECGYSLPKIISSNDLDQMEKPDNPEVLYAAINKVGISRKNEFPVPDEVWEVSDVKKSLHKMKTSSLPNYGTPRQSGGYRTPSLPRRLGVKMGTRAIYSSLAQKDTTLTDDMESLSLKSDTESSIQSLSARSTESPLPEAYVLNADIRANDETFRVPEDESMSASLAARLEELSFAEERILQTIKLERGHGGSIGLQVTEGNDGGVYVQAVSVGGSADMAGNVNKGDRIVAINGQNLLHLRYEDALKMLQSSSDTIELVLSQATSRKNAATRQSHEQPAENNYLNDIRFDVSSEADTSSMTNKWLVQRTTDVASVQNTSSAYSSAASSAMGNHNANSLYMADLVDNGALKSASMLLSIEDFDVSRTSAESASNAPPVPPRRKKRRAKPAAIARSAEEETSPTRLRKPDRKRLAPLPPPPPPPPPPRAIRRIKSHVARDQPQETSASNVQTADDAEETFNSLSSIESSQPPSLQSEDVEAEENQRNERQSGPRRETNSPRGRPFVFETRNKYPPLFFTLHDFQNVMSNTLQQQCHDDTNDEGCKPPVGLSGSFREFFEKPSLDDEESNLCFRVTTTNLPFERCLDRSWTATFADRLIDNVDESSRFIFEDYIDRSSKVNVRRSAGPMCCDSFQEEATIPRLTKVRFVIESPSSSTPDYELENDDEATCDSLQNIDPLADEEAEEVSWNRGSSVQLTEITDDMDCTDASRAFGQVQDISQEDPDEFGDVPFSSILRNSLDQWYSLEDTANFIEAIDKRSSGRSGRVDSRSDPQKQFSLCSEEKLKVEGELADVSEAESKTERCPPLAEVSDETADDNKEYLGEKDLSNGGCENENNLNANTDETVSGSKWELIRNEINANFVRVDSTNCEKNEYPTSEINSEKSTINGTKVPDQQPIKNEVESNVSKGHLLSDRIETEASEEEVSSAEGNGEIGKAQQAKTYSPDKSTGEYRRKLFVNESLRSMINRCDFTSNDLADESEDSDDDDDDNDDDVDDLNAGGIPSSESEIKRNDAKDKVRVTENSRTPKPECFGRRESIGASVNIRRSSFLENMLSEDSDLAWTSCKIVAVHRKSPPSSRKKEDDGLNEPGKIVEKSKRVVTTLVSPTAVEKMGRTAGEVKCDVLNELLSNFSNIRLKPVNRERRSAAESQPRATSPPRRKNDDEETESLSNSRGESLKDRSGPCEPSTDLRSGGTASSARQWQHAASLTTRRIRNDRDKEPSPATDSSTKLKESEEEANAVSRAEGTESEDHSELLESSKRSKALAEPRKSDDEARRGKASSVERLQMVGCSEKTDARKEDVSRGRGAYARQLELSESLESSGDKSAIVRRIPRAHCNNNDNNRAVTPVAVSDDQSRNDTVTMITPGRVRSFVKYYEIRREATIDRDSKTSDRVDKDPVPGHQSVFSIRRGFEAKSFEARKRDSRRETTMADQDLERSSGSARFSTTCIVHQELATRESSSRSASVEDDYVEVRKRTMHLSPVSVGDSCHSTHAGRAKRKKSVQFQSGFTVIGAKCPGENSSAGSPAGQDKKRSPDGPTLNDGLLSENVDSRAGQSEDLLDPRSFEERNAAAQMQAAAKCEECSGINRFVPKPETPRLVFYCTV